MHVLSVVLAGTITAPFYLYAARAESRIILIDKDTPSVINNLKIFLSKGVLEEFARAQVFTELEEKLGSTDRTYFAMNTEAS